MTQKSLIPTLKNPFGVKAMQIPFEFFQHNHNQLYHSGKLLYDDFEFGKNLALTIIVTRVFKNIFRN